MNGEGLGRWRWHYQVGECVPSMAEMTRTHNLRDDMAKVQGMNQMCGMREVLCEESFQNEPQMFGAKADGAPSRYVYVYICSFSNYDHPTHQPNPLHTKQWQSSSAVTGSATPVGETRRIQISSSREFPDSRPT